MFDNNNIEFKMLLEKRNFKWRKAVRNHLTLKNKVNQ